MNRVVKAAVAVTAFSLAAALSVPAQAEVRYNAARYDVGGVGGALSPISGLLGGLVGGGLLGGLLGGGSKAKDGQSTGTQMSEAEQDAIFESRAPYTSTPNSAEDVTNHGGPLPELSPILSGFSLGGSGLTSSLPLLSGAARMAQPATSAFTGSRGGYAAEDTTVRGAMGTVTGTLQGASVDPLTPIVKGATGVVAASGASGVYQGLASALGWVTTGLVS
ncbi:hypothetical protein ITP53_25295 [Nonomuraea sp. K274]|uniref:Secreted protein n=1 Tax=Nonomuraea cypriaca TaxID=1187855 RepID=A0A931EYP3_9ACTN|nr:hypothetical protein [Nonomuraea cypriaca]MBF8188989.1 hypothetical protein [Nonomuraea cypriaca]